MPKYFSENILKKKTVLGIVKYSYTIDFNEYATHHPLAFIQKCCNNWFVTYCALYKRGSLNYSKDKAIDVKGKEGDQERFTHFRMNKLGADYLLLYRDIVHSRLIHTSIEAVKAEELRKRKEIVNKTFLNKAEDAEITDENYTTLLTENAFPIDGMKKFLGEVKDLEGKGAGSESATSDIDVNMKGDGTEWAVNYINKKFRDQYGFESGIIFDINYYAKDYVPGKLFGLLDGPLQRDDASQKKGAYYDGHNWRDYHFEKYYSYNEDRKAQIKAALFMQCHNMKQSWTTYADHLPVGLHDHVTSNVTGAPDLVTTRTEALDAAKKAIKDDMDSGTANPYVTPQMKEWADSDILAQQTVAGKSIDMAAENKIYEEKLIPVSEKRILHEIHLMGDDSIQKDTSNSELKKAKLEALPYANEAYYSEGAVLTVVVAKQITSHMFERDQNDKKFLNLVMEPHEYYCSLCEQIGFAFSHLPQNNTDYLTKGVKGGKYIHRAYNVLKHLIFLYISNDILEGTAEPFTTEFKQRFNRERRAASDWEGAKQKQHYTEGEGYSAGLSEDQMKNCVDLITGNEGVYDYHAAVQEKLIELKKIGDQVYTLITNKEPQNPSDDAPVIYTPPSKLLLYHNNNQEIVDDIIANPKARYERFFPKYETT
ncbi:MAG: hypothetical protein OCD76_09545 [Reichenbachiella sp.]